MSRFGKRIQAAALAILMLTASALWALVNPDVCLACSCATPSTADAAGKSTAVFAGKALQVKPVPAIDESSGSVGYPDAALFQVERVYKGAPETQRLVIAGFGESSCGYTFHEGETYLVFAYPDGNGQLKTNLCIGTKKLSAASADLAVLGSGDAPTKQVDLSSEISPSRIAVVPLLASSLLHKAMNKLSQAGGEAPGLLAGAGLAVLALAVAAVTLRRRPIVRELAKYAGAAAAAGSIALWAALLFANPYAPPRLEDVLLPTILFVVLPAALALWASLARRHIALYIAFVWSLPLGLYLSATPGLFKWHGICVAVIGAAAVALHATSRRNN